MISPLLTTLVTLAFSNVLALDNGIALTPQMGWNSWNNYGCDISEDVMKANGKALVDEGLRDLGYNYIVNDDCYALHQRENGTNKIVADPQKYPNGMKNMTDALHADGLKVGIYSSAGTMTCGGYPGSLDFETIDAQTFADWGFDYLKYDNCFNLGREGTPKLSYDRYKIMGDALNATGRPFLYGLCNWGVDGPWNFAQTMANSWRMSGDIADTFDKFDDRCPCTSAIDCKLPGFHCSMARILDFAAPLGQKAGPGRWNDLDSLEVGNGGMSENEYVLHFSMWSAVKSPLILGNDLSNMDNSTKATIKNKHVIALNQDSAGSPAIRNYKKEVDGGSVQLWTGSLANGTYVVAVVNLATEKQTVSLPFSDIFPDQNQRSLRNESWDAYDLWKGVDFEMGTVPERLEKEEGSPFKESLGDVDVEGHSIKIFKIAQEGTDGMGTSDEEMKKREVEEVEQVMMGRAMQWREERDAFKRGGRGL